MIFREKIESLQGVSTDKLQTETEDILKSLIKVEICSNKDTGNVDATISMPDEQFARGTFISVLNKHGINYSNKEIERK